MKKIKVHCNSAVITVEPEREKNEIVNCNNSHKIDVGETSILEKSDIIKETV